MPIHDIKCESCDKILKNIVFQQSDYKDGLITYKCPGCGKSQFTVYWGSGQAPSVSVPPASPEEALRRSKTIGEFWDRSGLEIGGEKNKKANKERIEKMRKKAKNR